MKWQKLDLKNPPEGEVLAAWDNYFGVSIGLVKFTLKNGALMFHDDEAEYWREAECVLCYSRIYQPIPDLREERKI